MKFNKNGGITMLTINNKSAGRKELDEIISSTKQNNKTDDETYLKNWLNSEIEKNESVSKIDLPKIDTIKDGLDYIQNSKSFNAMFDLKIANKEIYYQVKNIMLKQYGKRSKSLFLFTLFAQEEFIKKGLVNKTSINFFNKEEMDKFLIYFNNNFLELKAKFNKIELEKKFKKGFEEFEIEKLTEDKAEQEIFFKPINNLKTMLEEQTKLRTFLKAYGGK